MKPTSFAELFDALLRDGGITMRGLAVRIHDPQNETIGLKADSLRAYRKGSRVPSAAAWNRIRKGVESMGVPVGPEFDAALRESRATRNHARTAFQGDAAPPQGPDPGSTAHRDPGVELDRYASDLVAHGSRERVESAIMSFENAAARLRRAITITGGESAYFSRWLQVLEAVEHERVLAYIRPLAGTPSGWFDGFYKQVEEAAASGRLDISYIFLEPSQGASRSAGYLDRIRRFASEVRFVCPERIGNAVSCLRPSIVLFKNQRIVFTHDREENGQMVDAQEWHGASSFEWYSDIYERISLASYGDDPL